MNSDKVALRHPVLPVADGFVGGFVRVYSVELRKGNGHLPPLPTDLHKHVVLAGILFGHTQDLGGFTLAERRYGLRGDAPCLEWEADLAFQTVVPAHGPLFRTSIDDCLVVDPIFSNRVSLGSFHDCSQDSASAPDPHAASDFGFANEGAMYRTR